MKTLNLVKNIEPNNFIKNIRTALVSCLSCLSTKSKTFPISFYVYTALKEPNKALLKQGNHKNLECIVMRYKFKKGLWQPSN